MILLMEGNKEKECQIRTILVANYEVVTVNQGREGLAMIDKELPCMVIMGTEFADMTGGELLDQLKQRKELDKIPIMVIADCESPEMEEEFLNRGVSEYLKWPIQSNVLYKRIERCMDWKHLQKSLEEQVLSKVLEVEEKKAEVEYQRSLTEKAGRDPLTGLLTRNGAMQRINAILDQQSYGSFCMLDMDNFKSVNDIYGHMEGDKLLIRFANILKKTAIGNEVIARIGGDEFVIFLQDNMSRHEILLYANKMMRAVQKGIISPGKLVKISVSMGVSLASQDGLTFEELYENADKALYYVKNAGKNAVRFYKEPKKKKNGQRNTCTTLKSIKQKIREREEMAGSYMVDYTSFENIYRFMERNIDRDKREVQCVLFTIDGLDAETTKREVVKEEMSYLEDAITSSLRKGDVSTMYSATQMLVLLMDVDRKNATSVVNRIVTEYHKQSQDERLNIVYEMDALGAEQLEIRAMNA